MKLFKWLLMVFVLLGIISLSESANTSKKTNCSKMRKKYKKLRRKYRRIQNKNKELLAKIKGI